MREKDPADIKGSGDGGERSAPGARARIPIQPIEIHSGAEIHLVSHGGLHIRAGSCPKEAMTPWKALSGTGFQQHPSPFGKRSPCCSRFAVRTCDSAGKPLWSRLLILDCT